jgi:hypothetical protein
MHDTFCFADLGTAAAAFVAQAAVVDAHGTVVGNQIFVGKHNKIVGAARFSGALSVSARFQAPSLRNINPLYVAPGAAGIAVDSPPAVQYHLDSPVPLEEAEPLTFERWDGAATEHLAVVHFSDGAIAPVTGEIRTVRFTTTIAVVLHVWTLAVIQFPDALANGDYDIVGARLVSATANAFRFVLQDEQSHRPGGITSPTFSAPDILEQRYGNMGAWGMFNTNRPPQIEIIGTAAAGAALLQGFMDVIKK